MSTVEERERRLADARDALVRAGRRLDGVRRRARHAGDRCKDAEERLARASDEGESSEAAAATAVLSSARGESERVGDDINSCLTEVEAALTVIDELIAEATGR